MQPFLFLFCPNKGRKLAVEGNATNIGRSKGCRDSKKEVGRRRGRRKKKKGEGKNRKKEEKGKRLTFHLRIHLCLRSVLLLGFRVEFPSWQDSWKILASTGYIGCQQGSQGELDKSSFNNEHDLGASQSL